MYPPTVVSGMGIISAVGQDTGEFHASLRQGRSGIGRLKTAAGMPIPVDIGADIRDFSFNLALQQYDCLKQDFIHKVKICALRSPLGIQASAIAALEAWQQARLFDAPIKPDRLGIVVAGSNISQNYQYGLVPGFLQAPEYLNPRYALHYMDTDQVGTLSEIFSIHGEGFTVGGASASGGAAIIKGCQLIQLGILDACLVVGALTDLSPLELQAFSSIGAMAGKRFRDEPDKACRPFDQDHEGFIYGQAAAALVLESPSSARARRVLVPAVISGGALVLDGNRLSDPGEQGEARAMQAAITQAQVRPADVQYINAHGTSSPLGDEAEIKAIKRVFDKNISHIWINSTKGLTGHTLTAAGVVETIAVIIQMQEGFVHPNLNLENPIDQDCRFCPGESTPASIDVAMSNSFGFGGINTSLILQKG